jgi:hypothetical protein
MVSWIHLILFLYYFSQLEEKILWKEHQKIFLYSNLCDNFYNFGKYENKHKNVNKLNYICVEFLQDLLKITRNIFIYIVLPFYLYNFSFFSIFSIK